MNLIEQAQDFVYNLLKDKLSSSFIYHNFDHTSDVVAAVKKLSEQEDLTEKELEMLLVAAWFHDTGYIEGFENHEEKSVKIAADFLTDKGKSTVYIEQLSTLIRATLYCYEPKNLLEKIIKDADFYHFATENYNDRCELLREEWKIVKQKQTSDLEWAQENLKMLTQCHQYYTDYAIANWQVLKDKNVSLIQEKIKKMEEDKEEKKAKKNKAEKPAKAAKPDRGIDTLFRVTLSNHTRLSGIADSKANILLSVNAIIISIALSSIVPKLDSPSNAHLVIPTFIMLTFSVVSIIFAILSTRPKVTTGVFTRQDIEDRKVNLLFFGNFYKMPLDEYEWAVNEMMKDNTYLYNSMIKDLYFLGIVLERKYKLLRITYNIFMIGIIISFLAFFLAFNSTRV
ncbi:Pycsar system effector family protein [Flavobacterium undicola]|uniref:Pycsar system effector family protein n=1 Tax=Flavobacterium undicola TaxID=1932779 RepID=UPI001376F424|nr:Pycsar system effector family protein [Flavobacterium undicola]MBA0883729.1 HD domain-containing protein [Flavobacterium undicola]